jgi:hypothetical protein
MRTTVLLVCALAVSSSAALAAPRLEEMRGCVTVRKDLDGRKCTLLRASDGNHHELIGRRLPPPGSGAVVLVRGKHANGKCALRIIVSGFAVKRWNFTRQICPREK